MRNSEKGFLNLFFNHLGFKHCLWFYCFTYYLQIVNHKAVHILCHLLADLSHVAVSTWNCQGKVFCQLDHRFFKKKFVKGEVRAGANGKGASSSSDFPRFQSAHLGGGATHLLEKTTKKNMGESLITISTRPGRTEKKLEMRKWPMNNSVFLHPTKRHVTEIVEWKKIATSRRAEPRFVIITLSLSY